MKMYGMKKALSILLLAMLAGCGVTGGERTDYQKDADKAKSLEVPPDLVLPRTDDHYTVPENGAAAATSYSEYVRSNAQNPACVCKEVAAVTAPQAAVVPPKLQDNPDGSKTILANESFDRCWLKVAQALDGAGIVVEDKDRSKGQFFLKGGMNQVLVKAVASGCEVSVIGGEGKHTIEAIYKQLEK